MAARDKKHTQMAASLVAEAVKSEFYLRCPKKDGGHGNDELRHGHFDHLVQYVAMGFNKEKAVEKMLPRKRAAACLFGLIEPSKC